MYINFSFYFLGKEGNTCTQLCKYVHVSQINVHNYNTVHKTNLKHLEIFPEPSSENLAH